MDTMTKRTTATRRGVTLPEREHRVLALLAQGYKVMQIGAEIGISPSYVYSLVRLLKARFGARTSAELVTRAIAEGVIVAELATEHEE